MGLLNFGLSGSYAHVKNVRYCKHSKNLNFELQVYDNQTSMNPVFSVPFSFNGANTMMQVYGIITAAEEIPETTEERRYYLSVADTFSVTNPPLGDQQITKNAICSGVNYQYVSVENGIEEEHTTFHWESRVPEYDDVVFNNADQKYYVYSVTQNTWTEATNFFDSRKWNENFTIDLIEAEGSSLYKNIYTHLKTRNEFAGVVDA